MIEIYKFSGEWHFGLTMMMILIWSLDTFTIIHREWVIEIKYGLPCVRVCILGHSTRIRYNSQVPGRWVRGSAWGRWPHFGNKYTFCVNTLRPRQNDRHFPDDIFKRIFLMKMFVPRGPIHNIPTLVQVMAWRRLGDKPLSEPMMVRIPTHIYVTRPQWVKVECLKMKSPLMCRRAALEIDHELPKEKAMEN